MPPVKRPGAWKRPEDVAGVSLSKDRSGRPVVIGKGGFFGYVQVGRVRFRDGTTKRVVVKRFFSLMWRMDDQIAAHYQRVIGDLRKAGVPLPKMGMVKTKTEAHPEGEWVLVSQLFGSVKHGSKIEAESCYVIAGRNAEEAVETQTKVANAGYLPWHDVVEQFRNRQKGTIPIDLDMVVMNGKKPPERCAGELADRMAEYSQSNPAAMARLANVALRTASAELRPFLEAELRKRKMI